MSKSELQTVLGYLNIGLAIAHNAGVSNGHFGGIDFIQLAQTVNNLLLHSITPEVSVAAPTAVSVAATTSVAVAS